MQIDFSIVQKALEIVLVNVSRNRLYHIQSCDHGGVAVCLPCIHVVKASLTLITFFILHIHQTTSLVLHLHPPQNGVSLQNNGAIATFFFSNSTC